MNTVKKVIILTGASSGIGESIARHLAQQGHQLVLGARRTGRLQALCDELRFGGASVDYLATDVTQRADTQQLADFALEKPFSIRELQEIIAQALHRPEILMSLQRTVA